MIEDLALRIEGYCNRNNLSIADFIRLSGCSSPVIYRLIRRERYPGLESVKKIKAQLIEEIKENEKEKRGS